MENEKLVERLREGADWPEVRPISASELREAAAALTAAEARIKMLEAKVARVQSDREYIIGWNAGWDEAAEQTLTFPTMLRKMWSGGEVQKWIDQQMSELRAAKALTGASDDR